MLRVYLRWCVRYTSDRMLVQIIRNLVKLLLTTSQLKEEQLTSGHLREELRYWFLCLISNRLGCCQGARKCIKRRIVLILHGFGTTSYLCVHEVALLLLDHGIIWTFSRGIHQLSYFQGFGLWEDDLLKAYALCFCFWLFFIGFFSFINV